MISVIQPRYITLSDWANNLIYDFGNERLPQLLNEKDWLEWGMIVSGMGIFKRANVPPPFGIVQGKKKQSFTDWNEWATQVYNLVNNELFIENTGGTNV